MAPGHPKAETAASAQVPEPLLSGRQSTLGLCAGLATEATLQDLPVRPLPGKGAERGRVRVLHRTPRTLNDFPRRLGEWMSVSLVRFPLRGRPAVELTSELFAGGGVLELLHRGVQHCLWLASYTGWLGALLHTVSHRRKKKLVALAIQDLTASLRQDPD